MRFGVSRSADISLRALEMRGRLARQVCSPMINDEWCEMTGLFTLLGTPIVAALHSWPGAILARNGSHRRRYPSWALSWLLHASSSTIASIWWAFPGARGLLRSSPFDSRPDQVFDQIWWIIVILNIIIKEPNRS